MDSFNFFFLESTMVCQSDIVRNYLRIILEGKRNGRTAMNCWEDGSCGLKLVYKYLAST